MRAGFAVMVMMAVFANDLVIAMVMFAVRAADMFGLWQMILLVRMHVLMRMHVLVFEIAIIFKMSTVPLLLAYSCY